MFAVAIDVGRILVQTLREANVQPKAFCLETGYDPPWFSRGCAAQGPLDLHRLAKAEFGVFMRLLRNLAVAAVLEEFEGDVQRLRMAKATLPADADRQRA